MSREQFLERAKVISEALPYMQRFAGRYCVIKYGGAAMQDKSLARLFASDVVMLKQVGIKPVVVHGGGPDISRMLDRLNIKTEFVDGIRVTDDKAIGIVEAILCGSINKNIVQEINRMGGRAVGICGKDASLIRAKKKQSACGGKDFGYVGEPECMQRQFIDDLESHGIIPVIAPVCYGADCDTYNVNSDAIAGFVARELGAAKLLMLTDVQGVLDAEKQLVSKVSAKKARAMIADGVVSGGMIPKLETCLEVVENGLGDAHILDGRARHVILLELFTVHGCGTMITNEG